jgi:aspartyl-tRNA(Asn)/glutamyl-tRNA(Gln) amidotransferase subunit A
LKKYSSFSDIQSDILSQKITCETLVAYYLQNIELRNAELNVFTSVYADEAKAQAKIIDEKIKNGTQGKLAGLIVGIKDVLAYQNHPLQASSKILDGFISQFNATAVQRLLDEDAIIIGRQNCDEFAMGSSNENSTYGLTRNAQDPTRVPGGSSGASAVAIQADMCLVSLGSDTGGSVRQPASFCGVVGLKPTYSRISRYGLVAYASSFDSIGIFGNNVIDVAKTLEVIAGADEYDSTVSKNNVPNYAQEILEKAPQKYKIAYITETLENEGLSTLVKEKTLSKIKSLQEAGHSVEAVDFPLLKYLLPVYYILTTAEASSNLGRYDGVRYGYRSKNVSDLKDLYVKTRSEGFGIEVQKRIILGTFVLSASYYDAYYTKAQKMRRLVKEATDKIFENYDFIVMPTTPNIAFKIGENQTDPVQMYLEDIFTVQANVVGIPAISIPNGTDENGLSVGFQIASSHFQEEKLLKFANEIQ